MSDLIDRYAAIELIHSLYPSAPIMRMNRKRWKKKYKPYIEAEKALEMFPSAELDPEWRKKHYEMSYNQGFVDACKYYENLPERKRGKWIEFPNHMAYKCSECGRIIQTTDGQRNVSKHYPFCHCGTDMRRDLS